MPGLHVKFSIGENNLTPHFGQTEGQGALDGTDLDDDVDKVFSYLRRMTSK